MDMEWNYYASVLTLQVSEEENGELREVTLRWNGAGERTVELVCYLEPVLARREDYEAHPAFSKLSLESRDLGNGRPLHPPSPAKRGKPSSSGGAVAGAEARSGYSRRRRWGGAALLGLRRGSDPPAPGNGGRGAGPLPAGPFSSDALRRD